MQSILNDIEVGKKIPFNDDYKDLQKKIEYNDMSVEQEKEEYLKEVIVKFQCEERNEYSERLKITPIRNYVRPIVDKMVGSIYQEYPVRPFEVANEELSRDANAMGKSFNELMQYLLKDGLIEGVAYAMPDTTNTSPGYISVAQQKLLGVRSFIRYIESENVINWTEIEDSLLEVVVLFEREEGIFARYYNNTDFVEIELNDKLIVQAIGELTQHGYEYLPVQRLVPSSNLEVSFAAPLCDIQAEIHNLNSLLATEIAENVYTRWVITNARIPDNEDGSQKMTFGVKRITVLDGDAKLQSMGSDTAQATTIQTAIKDAESALLKASGLSSSTYNESGVPVSGISRMIMREGWITLCSQIKNRMEQFENSLIYLLTSANGQTYEPSVYSDDFITPSKSEAILQMRDVLALNVPKVLKDKEISEFKETFYSLSNEEQVAFDAELAQEVPEVAPRGF